MSNNDRTAPGSVGRLHYAVDLMALRYGRSKHLAGIAFANEQGEACGKTHRQWEQACARQLRALLRLTAALRQAASTVHNRR